MRVECVISEGGVYDWRWWIVLIGDGGVYDW